MSAETRYSVTVGGRVQLVAPDDPIPGGMRTGALVRARLLDELTLQPVTAPVVITPFGAAFDSPQARASVNPRAATGGLVGLVGTASRAFPSLDVVAYDVGLRVATDGYLPVAVSQPLGPQPLFPQQFTAAVLPDLLLHRAPVILTGRTVLQGIGTTTALPGAVVQVTGLWRVAPTVVLAPPASPPDLVAIHPPLYAVAPAATTVIRMVTPAPDLANPKRLVRAVAAGAREVVLSNRVAIAAGQVLEVNAADVTRAESVVVASVVGAVSPAGEAVVTLEHPLANGHPAGAVARRVDLLAPGPNETLAMDAIGGDVTLLVTTAAAFAAGTVEITAGAGVPQYHRVSRYAVTSDADGYWALPPLSRVAVVEVRATHGAHPTVTRLVAPEYPRREQRADFVFS
ncbi:MAG: hypothetical protein IT355_06050 [Gemmatimonadaceae bacterium]|nr:hypothetical protein [Gemmatimonadaceae bacterium]